MSTAHALLTLRVIGAAIVFLIALGAVIVFPEIRSWWRLKREIVRIRERPHYTVGRDCYNDNYRAWTK